jgi:hypothetical protein
MYSRLFDGDAISLPAMCERSSSALKRSAEPIQLPIPGTICSQFGHKQNLIVEISPSTSWPRVFLQDLISNHDIQAPWSKGIRPVVCIHQGWVYNRRAADLRPPIFDFRANSHYSSHTCQRGFLLFCQSTSGKEKHCEKTVKHHHGYLAGPNHDKCLGQRNCP